MIMYGILAYWHIGVSENSVPLNPMVFMIIIPFFNGYFIGNIPNIFRQTQLQISNYSHFQCCLMMFNVDLSIKNGDFP